MALSILVIKRIFINVPNFIDKKVETDNSGLALGHSESSIYGIYSRLSHIDYRIFENTTEGMKAVASL
jgi:hypothetical protein